MVPSSLLQGLRELMSTLVNTEALPNQRTGWYRMPLLQTEVYGIQRHHQKYTQKARIGRIFSCTISGPPANNGETYVQGSPTLIALVQAASLPRTITVSLAQVNTAQESFMTFCVTATNITRVTRERWFLFAREGTLLCYVIVKYGVGITVI